MPQKKLVPAAKGEMGKPSLKGKFEAAMQKQYMSRPENQAKNFKPSLKKAVELPMTKKAKASSMKIK